MRFESVSVRSLGTYIYKLFCIKEFNSLPASVENMVSSE